VASLPPQDLIVADYQPQAVFAKTGLFNKLGVSHDSEAYEPSGP
jgi:hypothetical protein